MKEKFDDDLVEEKVEEIVIKFHFYMCMNLF